MHSLTPDPWVPAIALGFIIAAFCLAAAAWNGRRRQAEQIRERLEAVIHPPRPQYNPLEETRILRRTR